MRIQNVRQSRSKMSLPPNQFPLQSVSSVNRKLSYSFQAEDLTLESAYNVRSPTNSIPAIQRRSSIVSSLHNSVEEEEPHTLANYTTIVDETESAGRIREKANLIE